LYLIPTLTSKQNLILDQKEKRKDKKKKSKSYFNKELVRDD
jgi:hypothetical protein